MYQYIKQGIQKIKATRQYAREKNVPNWYMSLIGGILIAFIASTVLTLYSILFVSMSNPNSLIIFAFSHTVISYPFLLTFFIMMSIGPFLIKTMIYFTYLIQKALMKGINKLDMVLWKRTGKDSLASNFIIKHKRIVQIMFYIPLIITLVLRHLPK